MTVSGHDIRPDQPAAAVAGRAAAPDVRACDDAKIFIRQKGAVVQLHLNRPAALNAFDHEMCGVVSEEIPRLARNPEVYVVSWHSTSSKAFCAGGDVRALSQLARTDMAAVRGYFAAEYKMNWLLECFSKPSVSFINGLCMGSGAGLTCYNTHRIAGEGYRWAMPETAIGLFPDVGVAHVLSRLPWPVGLYLGLTGRMVEQADALWLGLATHALPSSSFDEIVNCFALAEPIDPVLDSRQERLSPGPLQAERSMIEDHFSEATVSGIITRLETSSGAAADWAARTRSDLARMSPLSLALTDRHIRSARGLDLRQTLIQDYRLAVRCLEASDFHEGVRAALIDKDRKPRWSPQSLPDVTEAMVDGYFAPLGGDDLHLPSREEMQAARV
jgi:enoyl-CoA hydratase